jgi:hypothetical protein
MPWVVLGSLVFVSHLPSSLISIVDDALSIAFLYAVPFSLLYAIIGGLVAAARFRSICGAMALVFGILGALMAARLLLMLSIHGC